MLNVAMRYMILGVLKSGKKEVNEIMSTPELRDVHDSLKTVIDREANIKEPQTGELIQGYCDEVNDIINEGLNKVNQDLFYDKYYMIDNVNVSLQDNDGRYLANLDAGNAYIKFPNPNPGVYKDVNKSVTFARNDPDDLIKVLQQHTVPVNNSTTFLIVDIVGWYRDTPINYIPPNLL